MGVSGCLPAGKSEKLGDCSDNIVDYPPPTEVGVLHVLCMLHNNNRDKM